MIDCGLLARAFEAFLPTVRPDIAEWCEQNISIPDGNAEPGPIRFKPHQKGILQAIDDPDAETIVVMLAAQTGKTQTIDCATMFLIANDPGTMLSVRPTETSATEYIRARLSKVIEQTPAVKKIMGRKLQASGGANNLRYREFAGGAIFVASSNSPNDLRSRPIRYLLFDEVDAFPKTTIEGEPVRLAMMRTATFSNRKIIMASTPVDKATSRIAEWFNRGTQERFFIPCPECGAFDYPRFESLTWTKSEPETARLVCDSCNHHMTEFERRRAIEQGLWKVTNENPDPGIRSFHATALISPFADVSLSKCIAEYEAAGDDPQKLRTFFNTWMGQPYDFGEEIALDANELQLRAEPLGKALPSWVRVITAGVDVQSNRIECSIVAHGDERRSFVLQHYVLPGNTDDIGGPWLELDRVLGGEYPTNDGGRMPISGTAIDTGHMQTRVVHFVVGQRKKQRPVIAIKGQGGWDKPVIRKGARILQLTQLYLIGTNNVKMSIQKRLANAEDGPGRIHFSGTLETEYFDGLASEQLRSKVNKKGYTEFAYVKLRGRNEPLDCLVYATAIATITRPLPVIRQNAAPKPSLGDQFAKLNALHKAA